MNILFMCVANSARSQMAEVLAKKILSKKFVIYSAGSKPAKIVNPLTLKVLEENKIKIRKLKPKSIEALPEDFRDKLDLVITLCEEEVCVLPPKSKATILHWPIPDPAKINSRSNMIGFRRAFYLIEQRIEELGAELFQTAKE